MFRRLLHAVRGCSTLLTPIGDHRLLARAVRALTLLARYHGRYAAPPERWVGGNDNVYALVHSLAEHLLGQYSVPRVLAMVWLEPDSEASREAREWFIAHANGERIRSIAGIPIPLTRRMERVLLTSPHDMDLRKAMRRAEAIALGAEPELVTAILETRLGERFEQAEYWRGVIQWLVHHWEDLRVGDVEPIVDFVQHQRFAARAQQGRGGLLVVPPPNPGFSLRGRTPESLARLMYDDGARPSKPRPGASTWPASGIVPRRYPEDELPGDYVACDPAMWELVELLDSTALNHEGSAMRHCVGSYVDYCVAGKSSIWSLRRRAPGLPAQSRCTIEIDPRRRKIVQVKAFANRPPNERVQWLLARWAEEAELLYPGGQAPRPEVVGEDRL